MVDEWILVTEKPNESLETFESNDWKRRQKVAEKTSLKVVQIERGRKANKKYRSSRLQLSQRLKKSEFGWIQGMHSDPFDFPVEFHLLANVTNENRKRLLPKSLLRQIGWQNVKSSSIFVQTKWELRKSEDDNLFQKKSGDKLESKSQQNSWVVPSENWPPNGLQCKQC